MIYTFGDGFAAGHIWPEWPQILEVVAQESVTNFGHIGAGNEYIFNCAVKSALRASPTDTFIIQWAKPDRFDKIVQDDIWRNLQSQDPVYKSITAQAYNQVWWATSASSLTEIDTYKNFYIQAEQSINRSVLYMISLSKMLTSLNIKHFYFFTYTDDYSLHENYKDLKNLPWLDMIGMHEWSKNISGRGDELQPKPIAHFKWVIDKILPKMDINLSSEIIEKITSILLNFNFEPFSSNRGQDWIAIKNEISLLFQ